MTEWRSQRRFLRDYPEGLRNHPEGYWNGRERERLTSAIERAAREDDGNEGISQRQ